MDKKAKEKQINNSVIEPSHSDKVEQHNIWPDEFQESSLSLSEVVAANPPWIWKMDSGNNQVEIIVKED